MTTFAELLTPEQVAHIHEASLEILEDVGVLVRHATARAYFSKHGCHVNSETGIVKFPRTVVEHYRAAFPPTFTFHGRDPQYDRTIPRDRPVIVTGSSAPNLTTIYVTHDQEEAMSMSGRIAVMRAGQVEQIGTPPDIYERPATPFVARFVGHTNLLTGRVTAREPTGQICLDTPVGRLVADDPQTRYATGQSIALVARPEQIAIRPHTQGRGANVVPATVQEAMYLGSLIRYTTRVCEKHILVVDVRNPREAGRFAHGDTVDLEIPTDAHLLPGEEPA